MNGRHIIEDIRRLVSRAPQGSEAMGAWFLGPRGESEPLLERLVELALRDAAAGRQKVYSHDPPWADSTSPGYKSEAARIEWYLGVLLERVARSSVPFSSYRYQGHMNWDTSLPAVAAYFGTMLYNQNNVAAEGGPVTTALEIEAAEQLCQMIGYRRTVSGVSEHWGHITCDGSVANIEAMWAARNVKLYPLAVRHALNHDEHLQRYADFEVDVTGGSRERLAELGWWELLNLSSEVILDIPERLLQLEGITEKGLSAIASRTVQHLGLGAFAAVHDESFGAEGRLRRSIAGLCVLAPASSHYSFPKATSLLGLGNKGFVPVRLRDDARVDIEELQQVLEKSHEQLVPVLAVVAVVGTTQESAVDDLSRILAVRNDSRRRGQDFLIHADAAWGGYFASLLNAPPEGSPSRIFLDSAIEVVRREHDSSSAAFGPALALTQLEAAERDDTALPAHEQLMLVAEISLSRHTQQQIGRLGEADSVTVDPHKAGFIPYPAGALLYRNRRMPRAVQITAPIVYHEGEAPTVGVFGLEGSKPGAAAAAVWLSHEIIHPDQGGYGRVLGRCVFNAKRLYSELATMESTYFRIATLQQLTSANKATVREWLGLENRDLWARLERNADEALLFREMGPDLNINTFVLNPKLVNKSTGAEFWNTLPSVANTFNARVFRTLSLEREGECWPPVVITGSEYDSVVAEALVVKLRGALGVDHDRHLPMKYLLSTTMNPWMSDADGGKRNMVREVAAHLKAAIEREVVAFRHELALS